MSGKRLIDVDEAKKKLRAVREWFVGHPSSEQDKLAQAVAKLCIEEIDKIKPVDAVEVVRCKDCKFNVANMNPDPLDMTDYSDVTCSFFMTDGILPNDYCSHGERKDNG